MNDIVSKLRKGGLWLWNQKEKIFLVALLGVLCFRVYSVFADLDPEAEIKSATTPTTTGPKPPGGSPAAPAAGAGAIRSDNVPTPPAKPTAERPEDFRPLVRQNPFTIYGAMQGEAKRGEGQQETVDVTLHRIMRWSDGSYRAEMSTKVSGRPKRYAEGEAFENYKVMSIDAVNNMVTIYSNVHEKTFTLTVPGS